MIRAVFVHVSHVVIGVVEFINLTKQDNLRVRSQSRRGEKGVQVGEFVEGDRVGQIADFFAFVIGAVLVGGKLATLRFEDEAGLIFVRLFVENRKGVVLVRFPDF